MALSHWLNTTNDLDASSMYGSIRILQFGDCKDLKSKTLLTEFTEAGKALISTSTRFGYSKTSNRNFGRSKVNNFWTMRSKHCFLGNFAICSMIAKIFGSNCENQMKFGVRSRVRKTDSGGSLDLESGSKGFVNLPLFKIAANLHV